MMPKTPSHIGADYFNPKHYLLPLFSSVLMEKDCEGSEFKAEGGRYHLMPVRMAVIKKTSVGILPCCSFSLTQVIGLIHLVDEALNNCHISLFHWGFTLECVF